MKLRTLLTMAIAALVLACMTLAWFASVNAVLRPFARDVFEDWKTQAVWIAEHPYPVRVGREMGVVVRPHAAPPRRDWDRGTHDGRNIAWHRGRNVVLVQVDGRWVAVERPLDLDRPARRLFQFLAVASIGVAIAALGLSAWAVRPLRATRTALERYASGEHQHRLPVQGPEELRAVAQAFNDMADTVAAHRRAHTELLAGISHELRTPLTRLRLELEILRDGLPTARADAMERDLAEVDALVSEVLDLSRLEMGARPLHREPVDLVALTSEFGVSATGSGTASIDRALARRAVKNLVENARRHGGGQIDAHADGQRLRIRDHGPGVAPDLLPRIFDPFVQGGSGGLGLGLMIVRQVVALHGGTVSAANADGGGLEVTLDWNAG